MADASAPIHALPDLNEPACRVCDAYVHIPKSSPSFGKCIRNAPQAVPVRFEPEMLTVPDGAGGFRQQPTGSVRIHLDGAFPLTRPDLLCCQFKRKLTNGTGGAAKHDPLPALPILGESSEITLPADVEPAGSDPL